MTLIPRPWNALTEWTPKRITVSALVGRILNLVDGRTHTRGQYLVVLPNGWQSRLGIPEESRLLDVHGFDMGAFDAVVHAVSGIYFSDQMRDGCIGLVDLDGAKIVERF